MKTAVVLAMHGVPPNDFPRHEMTELMGLDARLARVSGAEREVMERRHAELDARVRAWPRTAQNDPYHAASWEMAARISRITGLAVVVGFNEFCAPSLHEALDQAASLGVDRVVVITPMMTRGGGHAEEDIPAAMQAARERHSGATFVFAWPFVDSDVAELMAKQISRFMK
jgi:sirohydrochlorin cobaltochelatase